MKRAWIVAGLALTLGGACQKQQDSQAAHHAELRQVTPATFEIIPREGQMPYCLVFSRSQSGVIRQLTMTNENRSVPCPAGKPIEGARFRAPLDEGTVSIHILFSDQKLSAGSIAQQLYEHRGEASFHPMDLRLPGQVQLDTLEFTPTAETTTATTGGMVGAGGKIAAPAPATSAGNDAGVAPTETDGGTH